MTTAYSRRDAVPCPNSKRTGAPESSILDGLPTLAGLYRMLLGAMLRRALAPGDGHAGR